MPGRRPKPTAMKELAGNPGHRPLNDSEPRPDTGAPEMPKGMPAAARREWARIVPPLIQLGMLTSIDGKALAAYCDAYAHWEMARKEILKHGLLVEEPITGLEGAIIGTRYKANPAVSEYNTFSKLMKSYLIEFGLTPASRSKLKIEKANDTPDPMAELLTRPKAQADAKANAPLHFDTGVKSGMPDLGASVPDSATNFDA